MWSASSTRLPTGATTAPDHVTGGDQANLRAYRDGQKNAARPPA